MLGCRFRIKREQGSIKDLDNAIGMRTYSGRLSSGSYGPSMEPRPEHVREDAAEGGTAGQGHTYYRYTFGLINLIDCVNSLELSQQRHRELHSLPLRDVEKLSTFRHPTPRGASLQERHEQQLHLVCM